MNKNMKVLFFTLAILMNTFNDATAVDFWKYDASPAGGTACVSPATAVTHTVTYNGLLGFPTVTSACGSSCTAGTTTAGSAAAGTLVTTTLICEIATAATGAAAQPAVAKCITGTALTIASTLSTSAACPTTAKFCKNAYTATTATTGGYTVTGSCETTCVASVPAPSVGCSVIADGNAILGCYVGIYYSAPASGTTSSFNKQICLYNANSYCKNVYTYTTANGLTVTGSCEATCTSVTLSLTGTTATAGTTCSTTVFGNSYGSSSTLIPSGIVMLAMLLFAF